jgi:hydroxymethylpyrimidine/phosphomethylpyrimidine kinase
MIQDRDKTSSHPAVVLTIAGSDSGGGAGIQADLKTFSAFGAFGTSAVTCITAQNPNGVAGIRALDPDFVTQQIKMVCDGFPVAAAKTGMLYSAEIIRAVAQADVQQGIPVLVVDPVMVAASGARLLQPDAISAMCEDLLPQARVVTPNISEAEILIGRPITSVEELRAAAREIGDRFDIACLAKGGHLGGDEVVDVLYDEGEEFVFKGPRVLATQCHGSGCAFSAALTALLARGVLLNDAVHQAKNYVAGALKHALITGSHRPLNFFWNAPAPGT